MSYQHSIVGEAQTLAAAGTLVFLRPSSSVGFRVLRAWAKQAGTATSNQIRIQLGHKAIGTNPTLVSATPRKLDPKDAASVFTGATNGAAGTAGINATSEGDGAFEAKVNDAFNTLTGFEWTPVFEELRFRPGGDAFVMRFPATPAQTTGWEWGIIYEEV